MTESMNIELRKYMILGRKIDRDKNLNLGKIRKLARVTKTLFYL
jgi:hypothetical protein